MTNYGTVKSFNRPSEIEFTNTMVFVASNITPCEMVGSNGAENGFQYDYIAYTKDEYIASLAQELKAAKILLGVD
jgi:hypothetical protein